MDGDGMPCLAGSCAETEGFGERILVRGAGWGSEEDIQPWSGRRVNWVEVARLWSFILHVLLSFVVFFGFYSFYRSL